MEYAVYIGKRNVLTSSLANPSSSHERMPSPCGNPDAGRTPERTSIGQPVREDGVGGKSAAPNPRFLRSSSTGNPVDPLKGRNFTDFVIDQQRLQIQEPHFEKFPTPQTFSCWKIKFKTEVCSCAKFPTETMLWTK